MGHRVQVSAKAGPCHLTTVFLGAALATAGAAAAAGAAASAGAAVAVPVVESSTSAEPARYAQTSPQPAAGAAEPSRLGELFYQLQVLQQEVQELRGRVEEQDHRIERLARDQQEQYLDLDRRMQALRGGAGAGPARPAGAERPARTEESAPPGPSAGSNSEREAYAAAFELMKQRQFESSIDAFNRLIVDYPNGVYTPNAFYWLGELYLAQDQNEKARQSFAQVINLYPDHSKVPDALYKLGVVYHRLGDLARARDYLNRVRSDHPGSSAAGLAETYLAEL